MYVRTSLKACSYAWECVQSSLIVCTTGGSWRTSEGFKTYAKNQKKAEIKIPAIKKRKYFIG